MDVYPENSEVAKFEPPIGPDHELPAPTLNSASPEAPQTPHPHTTFYLVVFAVVSLAFFIISALILFMVKK